MFACLQVRVRVRVRVRVIRVSVRVRVRVRISVSVSFSVRVSVRVRVVPTPSEWFVGAVVQGPAIVGDENQHRVLSVSNYTLKSEDPFYSQSNILVLASLVSNHNIHSQVLRLKSLRPPRLPSLWNIRLIMQSQKLMIPLQSC